MDRQDTLKSFSPNISKHNMPRVRRKEFFPDKLTKAQDTTTDQSASNPSRKFPVCLQTDCPRPSKFLVFLCIMAIFASFTTTVAGQDQEGTWNTADYFKREHSLTKPYQGSGWQIPNWDFYGSTIVTNQYVRLTPDVRSQVGGIWNSVPVRMRNWEIHWEFKVHGKGKDLFGDGLILWYAKDRMAPGPVFGSKDYFMGLAIIVDTYSNHNGPHNHAHPYVSAMVNNGTLTYDHDRDGTLTQLAGCEAKTIRNSQQETYVSIRYEKDVLTVSTDVLGKNAWAECFRVQDVVLPTGYYLGLSAATGDLSDNHDVLSVKTYELDMVGDTDLGPRDHVLPSARYSEPPREHVEDPKPGLSGLKIFFYTLIGILVTVAVVVIGVIVYQNHENNSRKRFY